MTFSLLPASSSSCCVQMSSDSSIPNASSSSSHTSCNYEVFLSFRGPDVREEFLPCFEHELRNSGIDYFIDREGIKMGEPINEKLRDSINRVPVCVPIFSKNFASSRSCLMEVEQMVKSKKTILPIFYNVTPSDVRKQLVNDGEFYREHIKNNESEETLKLWESALKSASGILGEELGKKKDGHRGLIGRVVSGLRKFLENGLQYLPEHLVDISHHVSEVLRKLDIKHSNGEVSLHQELSGKRVVVIWGQQGIGKTTLAKAVYNKIRPLFQIQGCCFLENVRCKLDGKQDERRLISLQETLIRDLQAQTCVEIKGSVEGVKLISKKVHNKGVFIVLDGADCDWKQIKELMGDLHWLGPGSKVLVTTNNRDVVKDFKEGGREVVEHEVGRLPDGKVRELFCRHAFGSDSYSGDFSGNIEKIIPLFRGNPHYIELVGSFLNGKDNRKRRKVWEEMPKLLEVEPHESMQKLLKSKYENLGNYTKGIFLDIACLFNGMDQRIPSYLWEAQDPSPTSRIDELSNLSWLNLQGENELHMPELMVLFGKKIVKDEGSDNLLNRSRLWNHKDASQALEEILEPGSNKVKALCLEYDRPPTCCFSSKKLSLLSALRVLRLCHTEPDGDLKNKIPTALRWLAWKGCRRALDLCRFCATNLLVLDLSSSTQSVQPFVLEGWKEHIKEAKELKVLNLSGRSVTSKIFPLPESLEHLILERCFLDFSSVTVLPKLLSLNIKHCTLVKELPPALGDMEALKEILIDGAEIKAITLPCNLMKQLEVLSARKCKKLKQIPEFLDSCNMQVLSFEGCGEITKLPNSIEKLQHLEELDLSETMITEVTPSFHVLEKLEILRMRRTNLEVFPEAIQGMTRLKEIDFTGSGSMTGECDATSLSALRILKLSSTQVSVLRMSRTAYCNLEIIEYDDSTDLRFSRIRKYQSYAEDTV